MDDLYTEENYLHLADLYENAVEDFTPPPAYKHRQNIAARLREYSKNPKDEDAQVHYNTWAFFMPNAKL